MNHAIYNSVGKKEKIGGKSFIHKTRGFNQNLFKKYQGGAKLVLSPNEME
jgi:hypothetical protein